MNKRILWIEDESYVIKGLIRPLEKIGFQFDIAKCAVEAFQCAGNWKEYDLVVIDLIIPLRDDDEPLPDTVKKWEAGAYVGVELAKWLAGELKVEIPILLLSVIDNPIKTYNLSEYHIEHYLSKSGLLPSRLKQEVLAILGME